MATAATWQGGVEGLLLPRPHPVPAVVWSAEQWERVRYGLRPREMEQKWVSYTAEGTLHLHRSWTGFAIWEVAVAPVRGGGMRPVSALVESHPGRYGGAGGSGGDELFAGILGLAALGYQY